jgi:hypothetical protein
MADVYGYIDQHMARFRTELDEFLRIPSVSAKSEHMSGHEAGRRVAGGADARCRAREHHRADGGPPHRGGEYRGAGDGAPTVLVYGHYDVQPAEPLDEWTSPPFEPQVRDGRIYARGSVDDKGQLYLHIKAIEAHMKANGAPPRQRGGRGRGGRGGGEREPHAVHRGEQGPARLRLRGHQRQRHGGRGRAHHRHIAARAGVSGGPREGAPLRPPFGSYGGAVVNPATALARIIASLHDDDWRIAVPGFYDDVDPMEDYRAKLKDVPFDHARGSAPTRALKRWVRWASALRSGCGSGPRQRSTGC